MNNSEMNLFEDILKNVIEIIGELLILIGLS